MPAVGQNPRQPDLVLDLQERIAGLEDECRRLRARNREDAAMCRDSRKAAILLDRVERAAGLGFCEWHAQTGRCVAASPGLKRLLGLDDKTRLSAKSFVAAIHPEDRARYRDVTRRKRRAGDRYVIEYRLARSDGTVVRVRETGEPMPSLNGGAGTWLAWIQDISGERAPGKGDERYRDLMATAVEGVSIVRGERIVFANQAFADMFGFDDPEQLQALESVNSLIPEHDQERIKGYRQARMSGKPAPAHYVAQSVRRDGKPIWIEKIARALEWDGGPATQSIFVDVTERVEAEAALKESEQRFRDFARASSDWFWETGPDHRFTWASDPTIDGDGRAVIGATWRDLGRWDDDEAKWCTHLADLDAHRPFKDFRYRHHAPGSPEVHVSVSGVPVLAADGTFQGYRGTSTNVTAQVLAEREAARFATLLSDAIESLEDGLIMYDRDERIVLVNGCSTRAQAGIADLLTPGTSWEELVWAQLDRGIMVVPPEQREDWFRKLADLRRRGITRRLQTSDGRWFEVRDHRTRDGGCVSVRADITDFKLAEEALGESERRFRDFAESSSDWFWEMGPDHRFTWFSGKKSGGDDVFPSIIGKTRAEIAGADSDDPHWRDHQAVLDAHQPFSDFRYLRIGVNGTAFHVTSSGVPRFDTGGAFLGYRGTGKDITTQVLANQQLEWSQNMLRDAIEAVADGFLIYDRDDRLVVANDNCVKALPKIADLLQPGRTWEEIIRGQLDRGLIAVPARERAAWLRSQAEVHRQGGVRRYQSGGRWLELRDHRTGDGGCVTVRADITDLRHAQEALKASEQRFRDFAESSSDWFWEMGPDLRFTWFSVPSQMIGKTRLDAGIWDPDSKHWRDHLADLEARRPFKNLRYRLASNDDEEVYVSVSGVPVFGADGAFQGYRGSTADVSAQVRAEREAARAHELLTHAIETIDDGFMLFDADDRILMINESSRRSLSDVADILELGRTWEEVVKVQLERGLIKVPAGKAADVWLAEQHDAHRRGGGVRSYETADGRWLQIRDRRTRDGGCVTIRADVTEIKRAEQALKDGEQRFRDFAQASSDWFWEMGPDLRFTWFSDEILRGTGIRARDLIGKTRREAAKPDSGGKAWRQHLADLKAHRPFKDFRYVANRVPTGEVCVSVSGIPVHDAGGTFLGYRGTATDITAQVRAEREVAKAREMLADAVESIVDGFAMFDQDDRLVLANEGYRKRYAPVLDSQDSDVTWSGLVRAMIDRGLIKPPAKDLEAWFREQSEINHRAACVRQHETVDGRYIEIRNYPTRDGGFASVRHDVTALKLAERAREASEQRFKDFAEASSDWFWEMGPDLRFTWFSSETPGGTGIDAGDLIGQARRLPGDSTADPGRREEHLADLEARRPFKDFRYHVINADGGASYLSVSGVPIFGDGGRFLGYRGTGKNVTAEVLAEQRAALAQTMLSDAIESIRGGFALYDREDRLVLCNASFRTTLAGISDLLRPGTTWESGFRALVGRGLIKVPSEDPTGWLRQQIAMHGKAGCQRLLESSDGLWSDVREYPTRDGGLAIVRTDVTELKRAETALRESETLLKQAAQIADLGHWVWNAQTNRCLHCSDGLARMYDTTPEAYIAGHGKRRSGDTVLEEDKERYDEVIARATRLKKGYDIEFRERQADGSIRHMRERGQPVLDAAGTLVRMVGILQDISKHKRAEEALVRAHRELETRVDERTEALRTANHALRREIVERERTEAALRESRVLLEAIVETAAMGINVKDPSLRYLFMNAHQAEVYGVTPEQAVGKTPTELIGKDYGAYIEGLDLRVLQSGKPTPYFEEQIRDKKGVLRTWLTTKVPVRIGHNVLRYIVSASLDITELKDRERDLKQAQKMDAVGKLTGGIAHDFNNLLFVIRGNVALLKDEIRDSKAARESLGAIQDAAKLGADLTRSLLAFSRQQPLEPAVVHLPEVIARTTATLLRPFEKSIDIQTSYPKRAWPVLVDRHQMENALLNLALNARDAMPNGGSLRISVNNLRSPRVEYGQGRYLPPGDYVRLVVADSGVGMLPEVIDQAFEPFFTTKAAGAGTGLGLSMVYGFIKQSGGYIHIASKLGQGTTVTMHLPRTAGVGPKLEEAADDRRWIAKGTETILVTEDDAAVRRVAVRILTKLGYRTLEASNGPEALEILRSDALIDLLFADIILSGEMNGAQLSREAQVLRPDLKVAFASGYSEPAVLRDTEGADRVPLLSKPYDADELGRLIRGLLDEGRRRRKR